MQANWKAHSTVDLGIENRLNELYDEVDKVW